MSNLIFQNKIKPKMTKLKTIQDMIDARIIMKNLVYIIGLSPKIANRDLLIKYEYLAQFGKITKIIVNKNKAYNLNNLKGPSYSAYVTYAKPSEASVAILSLDNITIDEHLIRASFGTTKFCTFFLKNQECPNRDCLFLHASADENDVISKEDLISNKNIFLDQQLYAMKIADIFNTEVKKNILTGVDKKIRPIFPSPDSIYLKDFVRKYETSLFPVKTQIPWSNQNSNVNGKQKNLKISNLNQGANKKIFEEDNKKLIGENLIENIDYRKEEDSSKVETFNDEIELKNFNTGTSIKNFENINEDASVSNETTSTSSKEEITKENINFEQSNEKKDNSKSEIQRNLYLFRDTSRFDFANKNTNLGNCHDKVNVPDFVIELLKKNISIKKTFKKIEMTNEIFYKDANLEKEFNRSDPWAKFILENKHSNKDFEFIKDFENINKSLIDKFTTFYLK